MLYPNSEVVLVSSTIAQAKIIYNKIENELCGGRAGNGMSPVMQYLYRNKQIVFTVTKEGDMIVDFVFNGSSITVLPPIDSSRGHRATCIVYDEFRLMKKKDLDSIFEGMKRPRRAGFRTKIDTPYTDPMYLDEPKSCYISSSGWKTDWLWTLVKEVFIESTQSKSTPSALFAGDIYLALAHGLKSEKQVKSERAKMNETTYRIEMLNEVLGEAEDSYFKLEEFKRNQIIVKSYTLPTIAEWTSKKNMKNPKKKDNQYRIMFIDFAMATAPTTQANDNTIMGLLDCHWRDDHLERNVSYMESLDGGALDPVLRMREIYYDIGGIDYIAYDTRNGGDVYVKSMVQSIKHPQRGIEMRGFTVVHDREIQPSNYAKVEALSNLTVDPNAIPCLIPIIGSAELNSNMWMELKKCMQTGTIHFLIDETQFEQKYETEKRWFEMTTSERVRLRLPYGQTTELCNELINLTPTYKDGKIKLEEPKTQAGLKDRAVSLSYGNYVATMLENKLAKQCNQNDYGMDDWAKALL